MVGLLNFTLRLPHIYESLNVINKPVVIAYIMFM